MIDSECSVVVRDEGALAAPMRCAGLGELGEGGHGTDRDHHRPNHPEQGAAGVDDGVQTMVLVSFGAAYGYGSARQDRGGEHRMGQEQIRESPVTASQWQRHEGGRLLGWQSAIARKYVPAAPQWNIWEGPSRILTVRS